MPWKEAMDPGSSSSSAINRVCNFYKSAVLDSTSSLAQHTGNLDDY